MINAIGKRKSDEIFNALNRLNEAKQTGSLQDTELSKLIESVGDVFVNKVRQGAVTNDEIESVDAYLTGFTGENKDKYFAFPHKELDNAAKMFITKTHIAKREIDDRKFYSEAIMNSESYEKTFSKSL